MFTYPFSFLGGSNGTQEAATLFLNGVDQYVRLDDSRVYTASGSGTVSAWVNLASLSTDDGKMAFISKRENTFSRSWQLGYRESGNLFEFTVYHSSGETTVVSQLSPVLGDWYHVAGVFDDTNVKLYVNGSQVATATLSGSYIVSEALVYMGVAGQFTPNNLYNGSIAIPLIFNVAKTDAEILDLATARNPGNYSQVGMQVGIPLNTSVITPEENTISSNGDATLFGSPTYTGESLPLVTIPQVTGFSTLGLNGTTEYAEITHSSSINLSSEMTLSIWVNLDSLGVLGSDNLLGKINSTTGYRLEYVKFPVAKFGIVFYSGGVLKRVQTTTTPVTGAWYHVAGTYDGTTIKIYLNGVEENSSTFTGGIDTNTQNVTINATGSVAIATIFDSALSSTRISELSIAKDPSLYTQTDLVMGLPLNAGSSSPNDDTTSNGNDATLQGGAAINGKVLSIEQVSVPAELQSLILWLEGESGYIDKSTNTYTVTNNGSANTDTQNGLKVFTFNGSSDYINMGTQLGKPVSFTVISVINTNFLVTQYIAGSISSAGSATSVWGNFFLSQPGNPTGSLLCYNSSNTDFGTSWNTDNLLSANTWYVIAQRYTSGDDFIDIWVDGVQATIAQNAFGDSNEGTVYDYSIGRAGEFAATYFNGKIAEFMVSDAAESTQDILDVTSSLQDKYSL